MNCDRCFKPLAEGDHGQFLCPYEPRPKSVHIIGDELDGGARFFEHLDHEPIWIESKSHLKREMDKRNLQFGGRHDSAWHAKYRKLHDERLRDTGRVD